MTEYDFFLLEQNSARDILPGVEITKEYGESRFKEENAEKEQEFLILGNTYRMQYQYTVIWEFWDRPQRFYKNETGQFVYTDAESGEVVDFRSVPIPFEEFTEENCKKTLKALAKDHVDLSGMICELEETIWYSKTTGELQRTKDCFYTGEDLDGKKSVSYRVYYRRYLNGIPCGKEYVSERFTKDKTISFAFFKDADLPSEKETRIFLNAESATRAYLAENMSKEEERQVSQLLPCLWTRNGETFLCMSVLFGENKNTSATAQLTITLVLKPKKT